MRNFFNLEMDRTMTVDTYIQTLENSAERDTIGRFLDFSSSILLTINEGYGSASQLPELEIGEKHGPWRARDGGIDQEINSGLISHCLSLKIPEIENVLAIETSRIKIEPKIVSSIMLSWVLCHEYIHAVRKHNEVISELGLEADVCGAWNSTRIHAPRLLFIGVFTIFFAQQNYLTSR